jgi:hypothetical protein
MRNFGSMIATAVVVGLGITGIWLMVNLAAKLGAM